MSNNALYYIHLLKFCVPLPPILLIALLIHLLNFLWAKLLISPLFEQISQVLFINFFQVLKYRAKSSINIFFLETSLPQPSILCQSGFFVFVFKLSTALILWLLFVAFLMDNLLFFGCFPSYSLVLLKHILQRFLKKEWVENKRLSTWKSKVSLFYLHIRLVFQLGMEL